MAQPLDEATVRHVAHLARLALTDQEVACFSEQLAKILDYVEQLNEVDTSHAPPTAHVRSVRNVFRDDAIPVSWDARRAMKNAPQLQGPFFKVPKILDQESS